MFWRVGLAGRLRVAWLLFLDFGRVASVAVERQIVRRPGSTFRWGFREIQKLVNERLRACQPLMIIDGQHLVGRGRLTLDVLGKCSLKDGVGRVFCTPLKMGAGKIGVLLEPLLGREVHSVVVFSGPATAFLLSRRISAVVLRSADAFSTWVSSKRRAISRSWSCCRRCCSSTNACCFCCNLS